MTTLATVGSLLVNMRLDPSQFDKGARQVETRATQMRRRIVNGATIAGAGIALAGVAALKVGDDYKAATDSIRVGTGAVGQDLADLEASFQRVGGRVRESIGTTAQVMANLNTGLRLTGAPLEALTEKAIKFGRITGFDVANGTSDIIRLFGDWSVATEHQGEALDKVFRASQSTGIAVDHLMRLMVEYGAPMRQLGFDFDTAAAAMGKWQREGVNVEKIAAAMRIGLGRLLQEGFSETELVDEWNRRLIAIRDGTVDASEAVKLFGSRNAADMISALREGRFEFGQYVDAIRSGGDTIDAAIADTRTHADTIGEFVNRLKLAIGPVTDAFAGIAESMGMAIFLVPAMVGAATRAIAMVATSPRVLAAARATGMTIGAAARLGIIAGIGLLAIPLIIELEIVGKGIERQISDIAKQREAFAATPLEQSVAELAELEKRLKTVADQRHTLEVIDFIFPTDVLNSGAAVAEARATERLLEDRIATLRRSLESKARGEGEILAGAFLDGFVSTRIDNARLPELPSARPGSIEAPAVKAPPPMDFDAFIAGSLGNLRDRVRSSRGEVAAAMEDWKKSMDRPFRGFGKKLSSRIATVTKELKKAIKADDPVRAALAADMLTQLQGEQTEFQALKRSYKQRGADIIAEAERTKGPMQTKGDAIVKALRGSARAQAMPKAAMEQRGREVVNAANAVTPEMFTAGSNYGSQLAAGIRSSIPEVATASAEMGAAVSDHVKTSSPAKKGPLSKDGGPEAWGMRISALVARGITKHPIDPSNAIAPLSVAPRSSGATSGVGLRAGGSEEHIHIHVGTLVANDEGIDELGRRINRRVRIGSRNKSRRRNSVNG